MNAPQRAATIPRLPHSLSWEHCDSMLNGASSRSYHLRLNMSWQRVRERYHFNTTVRMQTRWTCSRHRCLFTRGRHHSPRQQRLAPCIICPRAAALKCTLLHRRPIRTLAHCQRHVYPKPFPRLTSCTRHKRRPIALYVRSANQIQVGISRWLILHHRHQTEVWRKRRRHDLP